MPRPYRVVVTRGGSDLDERHADVVARALRNAGVEVVYAPPSAGLDQLAEAALQEDADAVTLPQDQIDGLAAELTARGIDDMLVVPTEGDAAEVADRIVRGLGVDGVS